MRMRKLLETPLCERSDEQEHLSPGSLARPLRHEPLRHASPDELDRAVVRDLEPLREPPDGRSVALRQPADREEELVLLRLEARVTCARLAEIQKAPELVPQRSEGA